MSRQSHVPPPPRDPRLRSEATTSATSFVVLGIDPGSRVTGWGAIGGTALRPRLVDCGTVRLPRTLAFPERLHRLQLEIGRIVRVIRPSVAAVETPFHGVNPRSALQLAHARGAILAALAAAGVSVAEYEPAAIKKAVTGSGRGDKHQVQTMVARLLDAPVPRSADLADALAIALYHLQRERHRRSVAVALSGKAGGR